MAPHLRHLLLRLLHLVHAPGQLRLGLGFTLLGQCDLCVLPGLEGLDALVENIL